MLAFGRLRDPKVQFVYRPLDDFFFWHAHAIRVLNVFWPVTWNGFIL
jgi:hypothetical protein